MTDNFRAWYDATRPTDRVQRADFIDQMRREIRDLYSELSCPRALAERSETDQLVSVVRAMRDRVQGRPGYVWRRTELRSHVRRDMWYLFDTALMYLVEEGMLVWMDGDRYARSGDLDVPGDSRLST